MSNEITVRSSLQVRNGNIDYISRPSSFTADMSGSDGPTPGSFTVTTVPSNVDLSKLSSLGGMCRIMNYGAYNLHWGIKEPSSGKFFPLGMCKPGETFVIRLSDELGEEEVGTGTFVGTTNFAMRTRGGPVVALVEAFDP